MAHAKRPAPAAPGASRNDSPRAADGPLPAAARALYGAAGALLLLRAVAVFVPGRWLWGLDLGRDLAPATYVVPLLVTLLMFVPAPARALARLVPNSARGFGALAFALAAALALFLWAHPDRALYTGDASLRHGAFAALDHPEKLAEQALRGDLVLHYSAPRWVAAHTPWSAEQAGRAQGALLAVVTALAAWRLAVSLRADGTHGAVALAALTVAACTGALALDNGYGKASVEVACLTSIAAVGVAQAARTGRGLGTVGLAVGAALLLHRSALLLLPAWAACAGLVLRTGSRARAGTLVGLCVPPLALAVVGPRLLHVVGSFDVHKHLPSGGLGGTPAFVFAPAHLLDVFHTLCLLVPLAPLVPLLLWLPPRAPRREAVAFGALALPPLALLLVVNPQHGLARDWDVFAFAGSALAVVAAWRMTHVLSGMPRARWLALPLACVAAVPALQWAALQSDSNRMWARAEAVMLGPPLRSASERADGLGTIGMMRYGRGQYEPALRLFQRSAEAAPNPRTFVEWGMAETMLGRPAEAMAQYLHAASLNPDLPNAWRGVAAAASALGDRMRMEEAVRHLERLEPDGPTLRDARAWLAANPAPR